MPLRRKITPEYRAELREWAAQRQAEFVARIESGDHKPPTGPSLARKAWNLTRATAKWTAAGCPVRSADQIKEVYEICRACPLFKDDACTHLRCGCRLSPSGVLRNKIAWATESCPLDPPKWTAET